MADNRVKVDKWINVNQLSKYTQGKNTGCIDWNGSVGNNIDFKYGDIEGTVTITKYDGKRVFSNIMIMNIQLIMGILKGVK